MDKFEQLTERVERLEAQDKNRQSFNSFGYEETNAIKALFPRMLIGSATIDFSSIASGGNASATIPVGGARPGDIVAIGLPSTGVVDGRRIFTAFVSANDTVTLYISNENAGAVDPDSGLYTAIVFQSPV